MKKEQLKEIMQKENPRKKTKTDILRSKKEEIFYLHNSGYAVQQIVDYLKITYQLITSRQTISKFMRKEQYYGTIIEKATSDRTNRD